MAVPSGRPVALRLTDLAVTYCPIDPGVANDPDGCAARAGRTTVRGAPGPAELPRAPVRLTCRGPQLLHLPNVAHTAARASVGVSEAARMAG
jgi:hypothetical protein